MHDIYLVTGIILAALSIPAMLSAWSDGRVPRAPAIVVLIAGGLIVIAARSWPGGGLGFRDVPDAFLRVVAMVL